MLYNCPSLAIIFIALLLVLLNISTFCLSGDILTRVVCITNLVYLSFFAALSVVGCEVSWEIWLLGTIITFSPTISTR
jgi:hypothetical protein